ncbi:beta-phosphoglucomutase [Jeotgalibaca sp. MA1X17-3]|uniref:beta-phosphoglucomutase n=1 Tax=Jeotgalibaca sp. MA1X17-3 TaxID=2908211 RepID=UPI001F2A231D|nr:beta-phosphoglucomutase [Jeotgalibaca sp. MA1X17-3]UJF15211.1 beta-phosphoglucomutase [Jeotgalibaca sp. MA1X17-3]
MLKGIIFDLDGVITDTAEYHYVAWKEMGKKIGIDFDRDFNENLKGISRMDSLERILEYGGKANDYSREEKEELAYEKNEQYKKLIKQITPANILPGIKQLLEDCQQKEIRLALASASKNGPVIVERLELTEQFEVIVDPATLENGKPDPEIFLKAAELLGLSSEECIGIEDAEAGIESINRARMFSVGVGSADSMKEANYFVKDTNELNLKKILKKFENQ